MGGRGLTGTSESLDPDLTLQGVHDPLVLSYALLTGPGHTEEAPPCPTPVSCLGPRSRVLLLGRGAAGRFVARHHSPFLPTRPLRRPRLVDTLWNLSRVDAPSHPGPPSATPAKETRRGTSRHRDWWVGPGSYLGAGGLCTVTHSGGES